MIESALRMGVILIIGLIFNATLAIRCQAQTASDESNTAITATAGDKSANLVSSPNWSRVLKDYVLIPSPTPTPQITGPAGPAPTARPSDRVKVREYLAPWWPEAYASIRIGPKYINGIVGGLDQGSGVPFGVEFTTADKFSWVELRAAAITSTQLFGRLKLEAFFPHIGDERTRANVWFNYLLATQWNFFGIGSRTPDLRTSFQLEQRSYNGLLERYFIRRMRAGVYAGLANAGATNGNNDNVSPISALFSGDPAVTPITAWAPGLNMNSEILYYGLYGEYDGRNNERGLTKGFYLFGRFGSYDGLDNGALFTDYGWLWTLLDGRAYIPLGSDKTSFAARALASLQDPKGGSQIPFYYQSFIGGRLFLRGFRTYRFRANNALVLSAEPRQTVWAMNDDNTRGIDIHGFGDGGQVWGDNRSNTDPVILANDDFRSENWRFGVGGGVTYRHNRAFAVRIELGHSNEGNLVYLSLTRGF
ncbi:MAG: BamA/TamA family outer membrane protein [Blastocatellia bacterium]